MRILTFNKGIVHHSKFKRASTNLNNEIRLKWSVRECEFHNKALNNNRVENKSMFTETMYIIRVYIYLLYVCIYICMSSIIYYYGYVIGQGGK